MHRIHQNVAMRTAPLRACTWNARSAIFKAQLLEHFSAEFQLDILALQETWLSDEREFKLRGSLFIAEIALAGQVAASL